MNQQSNPEVIVTDLVNSALESVKLRQMAKANKSFLAIYALCREFPFIMWDNVQLLSLSKAFLLMHHFDTFDTEDENIELAHWAYVYAYRAYELSSLVNDEKIMFESLKDLVLILDGCNDDFTDTVTRYYLPKSGKVTQELISERRQMATRMLPLITYSFILTIDEHFNSFLEDEMIENICNSIELEYGAISEKLSADAKQITKMIYIYIQSKINAKDFTF